MLGATDWYSSADQSYYAGYNAYESGNYDASAYGGYGYGYDAATGT